MTVPAVRVCVSLGAGTTTGSSNITATESGTGDWDFIFWLFLAMLALSIIIGLFILYFRKENPMQQPKPDDILFVGRPYTCAGIMSLGLLPTIYIILSIFNFVFSILEAMFINAYFTDEWYTVFMVALVMEYYLILFPALCYGFHGLDLDGLKRLWHDSYLGKLSVAALPVTTVLSLLCAAFGLAYRCGNLAANRVVPWESDCGFLAVPLTMVLAVVLLPFTVVATVLLPCLWSMSINFHLYALLPRFYFAVEGAFAWAVDGALAFRFDQEWHEGDRCRVGKVTSLFHPGTDLKDDEVPEGMSAYSVAFLVRTSTAKLSRLMCLCFRKHAIVRLLQKLS